MRSASSLLLLLALLSLTLACLAEAQEPPTSTVDLEAKKYFYDLSTQEFEASGDVRVKYDSSVLTADSAKGNAATRELYAQNFQARVQAMFFKGMELVTQRLPVPGPPGQYQLTYFIKNGVFTTCDLEHPDYRISAREISVRPGERVIARHVSLWLGRLKVISVPRFSFSLGEGSSEQSLFPRPGYDSRDGAWLSFNQPIKTSGRSSLYVDLRATTRNGIQGGVTGDFLLSRNASATGPSSLLDLRTRPVTSVIKPEANLVRPSMLWSGTVSSQLKGFVSYYQKRRIFDIDAKELLLSTTPEIGIQWITSPRRILGTRISGYVAGRGSWGNFKESRLGQSHFRSDGRMTLSTLPIRLLANTFIQPALYLRVSDYDDGNTYTNRGISADLTQAFGNAYVSGRWLSYRASGVTPFESDDIDRFRELQGSLMYCGRRDAMGLLLRYAVDQRSFYDWDFTYTRRLHCLEPTITWENRFGLFRVDVRVLGLE